MFGIRDPRSRIRDPEKIHPGSRILGVKRHRIPDPGSGSTALALVAAGIIRRSDSAWASPLHMVPKKDGMWRPSGDYRHLNMLNMVTRPDCYLLPSLADFANKLHCCHYFSVVDLVNGYHQIPMAASDVAKMAILTPFGLRNAAQTF
jgi:hypothetical protein